MCLQVPRAVPDIWCGRAAISISTDDRRGIHRPSHGPCPRARGSTHCERNGPKQRCQSASGNIFASASTKLRRASKTMSYTPCKPAAFHCFRKSSQLDLSSLCPSPTPNLRLSPYVFSASPGCALARRS